MSSKLQACCSALIESCWLAAIVVIPLFFNISSVQVFEPDKVFILKLLALLAASAGLLKWIDSRQPEQNPAGQSASVPVLKHPMVYPVLALAAAYIVSSLFSILPFQSWNGLYSRAQGALTFCSYVILCLAVIAELKSRAQLRRIQYAFVIASLPIAAYTILQYFNLDFLPWQKAAEERFSGSMGNPIFLSAYLIMVVPLTFSQFWSSVKRIRKGRDRRAGF